MKLFAIGLLAAVLAAALSPVSASADGAICVFSEQNALAWSTVGKYAYTRLNQMRAQSTVQLEGEQRALRTDSAALEAQRATLSSEVWQQRQSALQQRTEQLNRDVELNEF